MSVWPCSPTDPPAIGPFIDCRHYLGFAGIIWAQSLCSKWPYFFFGFILCGITLRENIMYFMISYGIYGRYFCFGPEFHGHHHIHRIVVIGIWVHFSFSSHLLSNTDHQLFLDELVLSIWWCHSAWIDSLPRVILLRVSNGHIVSVLLSKGQEKSFIQGFDVAGISDVMFLCRQNMYIDVNML